MIVLPGTDNAHETSLIELLPPVFASRVRAVPVSQQEQEVCLRLEFYGCKMNGVAAYSAPRGM